MTRGNPHLAVRHTPAQRSRWKQAAEREGLDFSAWVRRHLDAAAGHPQVRTTTTGTALTCSHPPTRRKRKPYGTICEDCGVLVGVGGAA